jgi:16S rRNA (cytosine967-C5)-methyltransferase
MKPALARQAAFGALLAIDRGAWSAEALAAKSSHLDARDAALASDLVFGTLRHRGELDALIGQYSRRAVDKLDLSRGANGARNGALPASFSRSCSGSRGRE